MSMLSFNLSGEKTLSLTEQQLYCVRCYHIHDFIDSCNESLSILPFSFCYFDTCNWASCNIHGVQSFLILPRFLLGGWFVEEKPLESDLQSLHLSRALLFSIPVLSIGNNEELFENSGFRAMHQSNESLLLRGRSREPIFSACSKGLGASELLWAVKAIEMFYHFKRVVRGQEGTQNAF